MREVSSPIYQPVKVEGPSFPTGRASQVNFVNFSSFFLGEKTMVQRLMPFEVPAGLKAAYEEMDEQMRTR